MRSLFAFALVTTAVPALHAQQTPRDSSVLSPVVVTATRAPATRTATATTTVVTGAELRTRGVVQVADALRLVPGVVISPTGGEGAQASIFLRGGNSNFTKVLVDGVPVNAPGGAIDLSSLTADDIERIEVVRGPGSALHGSDAMTGTIQIFTRRTPGTLVEARAGSRDGLRDVVAEHASSAIAGAKRLSYSIGGGDHRGSGHLAFNNEFRNTTGRGRVALSGARGDVGLSATFTDSRYHYPTDGSGAVVDSNAFTGLDRATVALDARYAVSERLMLNMLAGGSRERAISRDDPDSPGDVAGYYSRSRGRGSRTMASAHAAVALPGSGSVVGGAAVEEQAVRSVSRDNFNLAPSTFDERRVNRALFAQLVTGPKRLTFDLGARRELYRGSRAVSTGRAAVVAELASGTLLRATVGRGFKEPALDQLYNTAFAVGDPDLHPERSHVVEVGGESRVRAVTVGATWFRQRFTDLIQYRFDPARPAAPNYYNVGAARADGLELEGRSAAWHGVAAHGAYTWLATEVLEPGSNALLEKGRPLFRRPARQGTFGVDAHLGGARVNAQLERIGARDDVAFVGFAANRVRLDAYTLLSAAAELPLGIVSRQMHTALILRGENIAGAGYENAAGYAMPGRTFYLGARARW